MAVLVTFDQNFRQQVAETGLTAWSSLDPPYVLCANQLQIWEQWYDTCCTVKYNTTSCHLKPLSCGSVIIPSLTPPMGHPTPKHPR